MQRKWVILRNLYNLEISRSAAQEEFTQRERLEIAQVGKPSYEMGAVGEFGIRKVLEKRLIKYMPVLQNYPCDSGIFWYDWKLGDDFWEVKSQPWWQPQKELVLQGDHTNFQSHYQKIDTLLIWALRGDTVTPLAMLDPVGVMKHHYGLMKGTGIGASLQVLHENGYMEVINDEWRKLFLSV